MPRPSTSDYAAFYQPYINQVEGNTVDGIISRYSRLLSDFYTQLPDDKAGYRYAEGKWTIAELIQHTVDAERVFSYRAMRIARKDSTALPGFDENVYAANSKANNRSLSSIKDEFIAVRKATDALLLSFDEEQLSERGIASNNTITVNALAFIIYGHLLHHKNILNERYL